MSSVFAIILKSFVFWRFVELGGFRDLYFLETQNGKNKFWWSLLPTFFELNWYIFYITQVKYQYIGYLNTYMCAVIFVMESGANM